MSNRSRTPKSFRKAIRRLRLAVIAAFRVHRHGGDLLLACDAVEKHGRAVRLAGPYNPHRMRAA
jgi:hypothetical protein